MLRYYRIPYAPFRMDRYAISRFLAAKSLAVTLHPLSLKKGGRMRRYGNGKCRWAGIEGTTYVDVDAMGDKARMAVALLRAADPEARACEQLEVNFESSGYYDPGKYSGPPENCYPEEGDDERQVTDVTLLLDQGQVRLADTLVRILASDPVVLTAVNGAEVEPPEPDYDAMWEAKRDREIDW